MSENPQERELTCIGCPSGCLLHVTLKDGRIADIQGYACPKGRTYAQKECTNPTRIVTSAVPVTGGELTMLSVRTASDIPKAKIGAVIDALRGVTAAAPVRIGDVVVPNAAGTGVDIIATRNVPAAPRV